MNAEIANTQNNNEVMNNSISKCFVRIVGEPTDESQGVPTVLFDSLSRSVNSWEESEYESEEEEENEEGLVVATGWLDLELRMTPAVFAEFQAHDPDAFESLTVAVVYVDSNHNPVYKHVFECDPTIDIDQQSGSSEGDVYISACLDYYNVSKFEPATSDDTDTIQ